MRELSVPPAIDDPKAFELIRIWIANKGQHVSLATQVWDDAAAWGIMQSIYPSALQTRMSKRREKIGLVYFKE